MAEKMIMKAKIRPNTIIVNSNAGIEPGARKAAIDPEMLEMGKNLSSSPDSQSFRRTLLDHSESIRTLLKTARQHLHDKHFESLEEVAIAMSNNALKLGAKDLLGSCIGLQNWSRCRAYLEAENVLNSIECEFILVREDLDTMSI